jgi:hypothetical protein
MNMVSFLNGSCCLNIYKDIQLIQSEVLFFSNK